MPAIAINGVRYPAVSTEVFGEGQDKVREVTLVAVVQDCVQLCEHDRLLEYAAESLEDPGLPLSGYADQVLAPHPDTGQYVAVELCFDHDKQGVPLIVLFAGEARLYEWPLA